MVWYETISILMVLTAVSCYINYRYMKLQKSIGIVIINLFLSILLTIGNEHGFSVSFINLLMDNIKFSETFLNVMLSFLLFAGSLHIDINELSRYKVLIVLLSTITVMISTLLIGVLVFIFTQMLCINFPLYYCFVFAALISPTDPIAVLGILKIVKAPRSLEFKIAGESLFNDGTGIVLFLVAIMFTSNFELKLSIVSIFFYFLQQCLGGLMLGSLIGVFISKILSKITDHEITVIITLAIVSGGYTLAHSFLDISGPICIAMTGLIIGDFLRNGIIDVNIAAKIKSFWFLLDEVLNATLFVLIGLEFFKTKFDYQTIVASFVIINICLFSRFISIIIPFICLLRFKLIDFDIAIVLTWCGLRGGISIALALSVEGHYHDFLVTVTYAVVIFSIIIQGITSKKLISIFLYRNDI